MTNPENYSVKIYNLQEQIDSLKNQVRILTLSNDELWRIVRRLTREDSSTEQESTQEDSSS